VSTTGIRAGEDLYLIPLTPPMNGYENFISAWLYLGGPRFLVDVGPASTVNSLFESLEQLGVRNLDYILLTHIHLDHAGAIGEVAAKFSNTPIVCQAAGIPHLSDPQRLWEGSQKVLGDIALGYGPVTAVSPERLVDAAEFDDPAIDVIQTPGHAVHHVSYIKGDYLFAGETAGVWLDVGPAGEYLRPATPPRFFLDTAVSSLERLTAVAPRWLCYGHFGIGEGARERLKRQLGQMRFWEQAIEDFTNRQPHDKNLEEKCRNMLLARDPLMKHFSALPPQIREREAYYVGNSIRGFLGWIESKKK
jgi:glyoxylase-like metal-dependent hydrolase (beta-lactamase superfamily II)